MFYKLFMPKQAVGANLVYFDLFNVGGTNASGRRLEVDYIIPVVSGEAAVTGVLGVDLFLTRTTAVGTGGTAATAEGTSLTAPQITHQNGSHPIDLKGISARLTPSGGATAGAVLSWRSVFTEETNSGAYNQIWDMVKATDPRAPAITVPPGTGLRVVQGGVASVGNIGFDIGFWVYPL